MSANPTMTDLLDLLADMDRPPLVAPWDYTDEAFPVEELDRTIEAWRREGPRLPGGYAGWHRGYASSPGPDGHDYVETVARHPERGLVVRGHCSCGWVSGIGETHEVVAAWHDHAWPGWRNLPVISDVPGDRGFNKAVMKKWRASLIDVQPLDFQTRWAPVVTLRESPGTRDVPGYSPWGGFDICYHTLEVAA